MKNDRIPPQSPGDQALSRGIRGYALAIRALLLGAAACTVLFLLNLILWNRTGTAFLWLCGVVPLIFLTGWAASRQKQLIWNHLGGEIHQQIEERFGPALQEPGMTIGEALIRQGAMIPCPWEESRITENRVGLYHGLRFFAANVELVHEYDAMMNREGVTDVLRETVFSGSCLAVEARRPFPAAFRVLPGEDGAFTGDPAFDRRFSVSADDPRAARELLTPERRALLLEIADLHPVSFAFLEDRVLLALGGPPRFLAIGSDIDVKNIDTLRQSFRRSLDHTAAILDILARDDRLHPTGEKGHAV